MTWWQLKVQAYMIALIILRLRAVCFLCSQYFSTTASSSKLIKTSPNTQQHAFTPSMLFAVWVLHGTNPSLSSNNNNKKKILLQNWQWKSIASCKFCQALQRDTNTATPLSAFIWDIVNEMFNGLTQVYFMFWTAPKVKERALKFYSLCLMQYHAAVAWAVIKRRATTRMHTLWFMEPMDPTAEIKEKNISFMGPK